MVAAAVFVGAVSSGCAGAAAPEDQADGRLTGAAPEETISEPTGMDEATGGGDLDRPNSTFAYEDQS